MPNIYLRLPHHVASYFRNRYEDNPITVGSPVALKPNEYYYTYLDSLIYNAKENKVNHRFAFSDRQWKLMLDHQFVGKEPGNVDYTKMKLINAGSLTDEEISFLTGINSNNDRDNTEYLCIPLPREVMRNFKLQRVTDRWLLNENAARRLISLMTAEFWNTFFTYIDKDESWCLKMDVKRTLMERMERFMMRYDIDRNHKRVLQMLKRSYYRKNAGICYNDEEFAEHSVSEEEARKMKNKNTNVYCNI